MNVQGTKQAKYSTRQTGKKCRGHIAAPKKTYFYLEEEDKDDPLVPSMPNLIAFLCHLR